MLIVEFYFSLDVKAGDNISLDNLECFLPVNSEAIYENWLSILCGGQAEAFDQNQDARGLAVVKACIVTHDCEVKQDVDIGNLMGVERCHIDVRVRDQVTLLCHHLEEKSRSNKLGVLHLIELYLINWLLRWMRMRALMGKI